MDAQVHQKRRRYKAVIASTAISLACGANYAFSAWSTQFADRLQLSATQINLVGAAGNAGMYAVGIPLGILADRGPFPNMFGGAFITSGGYYFLREAFLHHAPILSTNTNTTTVSSTIPDINGLAPSAASIAWLCLLSFATGVGGCAAFIASVKTAALNWPQHRGTATAFPLAAFGLSALAFSALSAVLTPNSTSGYLMVLTVGCFLLMFVSPFFVSVPKADEYQRLLTHSNDSTSIVVSNSASQQRRDSNALRPVAWAINQPDGVPNSNSQILLAPEIDDEAISLMSSDSAVGDLEQESMKASFHLQTVDVRGLKLLTRFDFYLLFLLLGVLTGIGIMTINNIGQNSTALWRHYDPKKDAKFIASLQLLQVSILSCFSFLGRLCSGIGSDYLVKQMHKSRFWCLVASSFIFAFGQIAALKISTPQWLWIVSSSNGLAYGTLFGVYPTLIADTFGVGGLSQNWGTMTMAPVLFGNLFTVLYGMVFDSNSVMLPNGDLVCNKGHSCYYAAYLFTAVTSIIGIVGVFGAAMRDTRRIANQCLPKTE